RRPDWRMAPRAVFVGRLAPEKGLDTLVDAWPLVRAAYPEARLMLIGEGPERAALEARLGVLGLTLGPGQAVELPGAVAAARAAPRGIGSNKNSRSGSWPASTWSCSRTSWGTEVGSRQGRQASRTGRATGNAHRAKDTP